MAQETRSGVVASVFGLGLAVVLAAALGATVADAATINVQPIVVCNDAGGSCAGNPLTSTQAQKFIDVTNAALAQLGLTVNFLPSTQLNNTGFQNVECPTSPCTELVSLATGAGHGQNADPSVYNMWFVDQVNSGGAWGVGAFPGNGVAISDDIIAANRFDTLAHELAHNFGFDPSATSGHVSDQTALMADGTNRIIPATATDVNPNGLQLDKINGDAPAVTVDTLGDTPFQNPSFFNVTFNQSKPGVTLTSLTLDITPVNAFFDPTLAPPGLGPFSFTTTNLVNIAAGDITLVPPVVDGDQVLTMLFAPGSFVAGDSFSFSIDIDLFTNIDGFGATPAELEGSIFGFRFSNGYAAASALDGGIATSVFNPDRAPVAAFRTAGVDPVPGPAPLLVVGLAVLAAGVWRRRRSA
jgi:hypothetical protein